MDGERNHRTGATNFTPATRSGLATGMRRGTFPRSLHSVPTGLFPKAKFILTVRDPRSWLRSVIDQCINNDREDLLQRDPQFRWVELRDLYYGPPPKDYPPEETILKKYNMHTISEFLRHWARHNRIVLSAIPTSRLLIVRTSKISDSLSRIAFFVGISPDKLNRDKHHAYQAPKRHGVLDDLDESYLQTQIERLCGPVLERLDSFEFDKL